MRMIALTMVKLTRQIPKSICSFGQHCILKCVSVMPGSHIRYAHRVHAVRDCYACSCSQSGWLDNNPTF
jgi:hypothetical protein